MTALMVIVLLVDTAAVLTMAGIIWAVQIVQYPLMAHVGHNHWNAYHNAHCRRILLIVAPPMLAGPVASFWLARTGLPGVPWWLLWAGFACAVLAWIITITVSAPLHRRLSHGWSAAAHRALGQTNGVRTALWTVHALLVLATLYRLLTQLRL